jgi:hypothetical protein
LGRFKKFNEAAYSMKVSVEIALAKGCDAIYCMVSSFTNILVAKH